jgi:hypothetical protein
MVRQIISAVFIASLLVSTGCNVQRPQLAHPGPMVHQQHYATLHDPYPDTEAGPEVVGGRPLSYMKQLPEAVRSRHLVDSWWSGF